MNKKGISVVSLSVTIVILLVILSTISVSITYSVANAKKLTFAKEIYNIQSLVTEYIQKENVLPLSTETIEIKPSNLEQFEINKEKITDGKLILNTLDLTELDIVNTNYGNKKIGETDQDKEKDLYAVSTETGRVYYIAGFKDKNKTYYTLTDDLLKMIEKKQDLLISEKTIIFTPSKLGWSNDAISVRVTVPETYEITNFGINNENIKYTEETVDNAKIYNVNLDKVLENYEITVNYTKDETAGNVRYKTKLDLTQPSISKDEKVTNTSTAIKGINAVDEESGIKYFKYAEGIINDFNVKEYMKSYGRNINNGSIKMKTKSVYTLYAEDKAGNYFVLHLDGDGQRFYPTITTATGQYELTLNNSYNLSLINYTIYGNSVQDGLPSPNSPVEIQSVGELVTDESDEHFGKYNIPITVSGKNLINIGEVKTYGTVRKYIDVFLTPGTYYYTSNLHSESGVTFYTGIINNDTLGFSDAIKMISPFQGMQDSGTFTITEGKTYRFLIYCSNADIYASLENVWDNIWIQIELGNAATSFEPYIEPKTYNIYMNEPLRKLGNAVDYIDFKNQKVVRSVGEDALIGDTNFIYSATYFGGCIVAHRPIADKYSKVNEKVENISTHFGPSVLRVQHVGSTSRQAFGFPVSDDISTVDDLKTFLINNYNNGNPVKVYYPLSTAKAEKITIPEIKLNYGTNIIKVGTDIAPSQTDITYYKKQ